MLRGYAHYMKQIRFGFGEHFISDTLNTHSALASQLVELFETRFDPATVDPDRYQRLSDGFVLGLDDVELLNEDRILRRFDDPADDPPSLEPEQPRELSGPARWRLASPS